MVNQTNTTSPTNTAISPSSSSPIPSSSSAISSSYSTSSSSPSNEASIGIGVGVGLTFVVAAIIILVLLLLYRQRKSNRHDNIPTPDVSGTEIPEILLSDFPDRSPKPMKISDLINSLEQRRSDKSVYSEEFKSLPPANPPRLKSCTDALKFKSKNRYLDILPYNEDRVKLVDPSNDYINASFIDGYNAARAYIATQGPLNTTCTDFWSMVWEQKSKKIIMVANLIEDGVSKCAQYFPKMGCEKEVMPSSMTFGGFVISLVSEVKQSDYIVRVFNVTKENETRTVRQYHYTEWPDKGVPDNSTSLLKFYKVCFAKEEESSGPTIIHCSAGVGRTGTLLAVDILLDQAADKGEIDVAFCVDKMRRRRLAMIQTLTQYIFTYYTMAEILLVGDVSIPKSDFKEYFSNIQRPVKFNKSILELQFELLNASKPVFSESNYTQGTANKHLNRFSKVLPIDDFKAFLKSNDGDDKYINAVFVSSHETKDRFIVTHAPLQNNMENFWELVKEYNCSAIIMLNDLLPDEENYWPDDGESKTCGELTIKNFGEISSDNVVLSQLRISHLIVAQHEKTTLGVINEGADFEETDQELEMNNPDDSINVRHIRATCWPEGESGEERKESLLSMVAEAFTCVDRNPETMILVHCMNGAERSGLFCALYCILEKLKSKGEVDVFNSVKKIQKTRPEFIHSTQQLRILYEITACHLSSEET